MENETQALVKPFQKVFVAPNFWLPNNCVFLSSKIWTVTKTTRVMNIVQIGFAFDKCH